MRNDVNAFWVTWVGEKKGSRRKARKNQPESWKYSISLELKMLRIFRHSFTRSVMISTDGWKIDRNSRVTIRLTFLFSIGVLERINLVILMMKNYDDFQDFNWFYSMIQIKITMQKIIYWLINIKCYISFFKPRIILQLAKHWTKERKRHIKSAFITSIERTIFSFPHWSTGVKLYQVISSTSWLITSPFAL